MEGPLHPHLQCQILAVTVSEEYESNYSICIRKKEDVRLKCVRDARQSRAKRMIGECAILSGLYGVRGIIKSEHFEGTEAFKSRFCKSAKVVIDRRSSLWWMREKQRLWWGGEGRGSPRMCRMIKAAIGDSGIGRVWVEIRGE